MQANKASVHALFLRHACRRHLLESGFHVVVRDQYHLVIMEVVPKASRNARDLQHDAAVPGSVEVSENRTTKRNVEAIVSTFEYGRTSFHRALASKAGESVGCRWYVQLCLLE